MRVKKAKKPRRSIEYLLSADSRLRKISLKKLSDRWTKAKGSLRSSRSKSKKKSPAAKHGSLFPWAMSPRAMVLGVMCMLVAAALITARQASYEPVVSSSVDAAPAADILLERSPEPARPASRKAVAKTSPKPAAARTSSADVSMRSATSAVASPKALTVESTPKSSAVEFAPKPAAAEPTVTADVQSVPPTTIVGCLEFANDTFRLKDTSGEDAPKSRSWKSGFLRKRPASIELADPSAALRLRRYVGQRVAVTGTLNDREMQPRSVRRVAGSCD